MFKKITLTLGVLALITATATKTAAKPFNRVGYACVNLTAVGSSAANIDSALKQADGVAYQASIPGGAKSCYVRVWHDGSNTPDLGTYKSAGRSCRRYRSGNNACNPSLQGPAYAIMFSDSAKDEDVLDMINDNDFDDVAAESNMNSVEDKLGL